MPPKKPDARSEKGQQKAAEREKQKAVDDKTFGLKNKNKSKAVQKYIKGVQQTAHPKGDAAAANKEHLAREQKKKDQQQQALLASLFRGAESAKTAAEKEKLKLDPKQLRQDAKIDLYTDKRCAAEDWDQAQLEEVVREKHCEQAQARGTSIVCKHFLDAIEKRQYGWFWVCPNGGEACQYRHALPPGFVFNEAKPEVDLEGEEELFEDTIERERAALPLGGTKVTKETFEMWKKGQVDKLKAAEEQRQAEAKKRGKPQVLSGRDLFSWNPSLFVDDDEAASDEEYEDSEDEDDNGEEDDDEREESSSRSGSEDGPQPLGISGAAPINEDLFLLEDLPEDVEL